MSAKPDRWRIFAYKPSDSIFQFLPIRFNSSLKKIEFFDDGRLTCDIVHSSFKQVYTWDNFDFRKCDATYLYTFLEVWKSGSLENYKKKIKILFLNKFIS
jgi:hypothetical protein